MQIGPCVIVFRVGDQALVNECDLGLEQCEVGVEVSEKGETMMPYLIGFEVFRSKGVHQRQFFEKVALEVQEGRESVLPVSKEVIVARGMATSQT
jgi:hypothetical protein